MKEYERRINTIIKAYKVSSPTLEEAIEQIGKDALRAIEKKDSRYWEERRRKFEDYANNWKKELLDSLEEVVKKELKNDF